MQGYAREDVPATGTLHSHQQSSISEGTQNSLDSIGQADLRDLQTISKPIGLIESTSSEAAAKPHIKGKTQISLIEHTMKPPRGTVNTALDTEVHNSKRTVSSHKLTAHSARTRNSPATNREQSQHKPPKRQDDPTSNTLKAAGGHTDGHNSQACLSHHDLSCSLRV